jgi:DNA-binding XRE family transcriptional regulator
LDIKNLEGIEVMDDIERLIILRKRLNHMKQYQLARHIGISTNYLVAIENYKRPLTDCMKNKINGFIQRHNTEIKTNEQQCHYLL